jgi:hypothetical protein
MRWACMAVKRTAYGVLIGKHEGRKPLGRFRCRLNKNIKRNLKGTGWKGVEWINLDHNRDQWWTIVNVIMNLPVP